MVKVSWYLSYFNRVIYLDAMTRRWRLLVFFSTVSALFTFFVVHSVARIEDKYFETHRVFLDPAVYQEHLYKLWEASHQHDRLELASDQIRSQLRV